MGVLKISTLPTHEKKETRLDGVLALMSRLEATTSINQLGRSYTHPGQLDHRAYQDDTLPSVSSRLESPLGV